MQWNILDVDECERDMHDCDGNATCTNTRGGYNCSCDNGFSGNGSLCEGEVVVFLKLITNLRFTNYFRDIFLEMIE